MKSGPLVLWVSVLASVALAQTPAPTPVPVERSIELFNTHTRETECFHVIEGQFRFWCGGDVFEGGPGATLVAPPHKRHRWENVGSKTGRLLMWVTPGGFERFFGEVDALADPTPQAILEIETRYGIISEILSETSGVETA